MSVHVAQASEFQFVEGLPKRVQRKLQRGMDAFSEVVREFQAANERHGLLVPISTVSESLGCSTQYVGELLDKERLRGVDVCGRRWVIAASVFEHLAAGPRPKGRPRKLGTVHQTLNVARELAAAAEKKLD